MRIWNLLPGAALALVVVGLVAAVGDDPRLLEELRIGGGQGEAADGGLDIDRQGNLKTDGGVHLGGAFSFSAVREFATYDATPSVAGGTCFLTSPSATVITGFDDGETGQLITLVGQMGVYSTTVSDNANLRLAGMWAADAGDTLTLLFDGGQWVELARSDN
jgi:hypothetical protein